MERTKSVLVYLLLLYPPLSLSSPYYGANISTVLYGKEPPHLKGIQFMLVYDPNTLCWNRFRLYFDGGFSHFWDTDAAYFTALNIYSIAPVIRYTFSAPPARLMYHPYIEISIGLSYLNHTHFEDRKLGIHFAFQDRIGIGVYFGNQKQINVGLHAVHYSNAHLSGNNSGITAPLVLDIGYRFQ